MTKKEQVILIKDVPSTGEAGEKVTVSKGFARNYLVPRGFALPDRAFGRHLLVSKRDTFVTMQGKKREDALLIKEQLESEPIEIAMQVGDKGKIFGAITTILIHDIFLKKNIHIERKNIHLNQHVIHTVGQYYIEVVVYQDIVARVSLVVVAKPSDKPVGGVRASIKAPRLKSTGLKEDSRSTQLSQKIGEQEQTAQTDAQSAPPDINSSLDKESSESKESSDSSASLDLLDSLESLESSDSSAE